MKNSWSKIPEYKAAHRSQYCCIRQASLFDVYVNTNEANGIGVFPYWHIRRSIYRKRSGAPYSPRCYRLKTSLPTCNSLLTRYISIKFKSIITTWYSLFQMLKSCRKLSMTVRSPTLPSGLGCGGAPWQMRHTCSWMDRHGRPVSPPVEYTRSGQRYGGYGFKTNKDRSIRRVSIEVYDRVLINLRLWKAVKASLTNNARKMDYIECGKYTDFTRGYT